MRSLSSLSLIRMKIHDIKHGSWGLGNYLSGRALAWQGPAFDPQQPPQNKTKQPPPTQKQTNEKHQTRLLEVGQGVCVVS